MRTPDAAAFPLLLPLLCAACLLLAGYSLLYFADYANWFIHPHQFEIHLPQLLAGGSEARLGGFSNIFRQFDPTESRPRFLAYAIIWANLHLRMALYDLLVLFPPFSIAWILEILVGPLLLYRLARNMSNSPAAGMVALIVYLTSIGFLSGFAMALMPSKPLTNVVFIATLWLLSEAKRGSTPGLLLHEVANGRRYVIALGAVLLVGLFLDEVPLFAFALPLLFYRELFLAGWPGRVDFKRSIPTWLALAVPLLLFLLVVTVIVPPITKKLFGYSFDFISSVMVNREAAEGGKSFFSGKEYGFGPASLVANLVSLIGSAFVPWTVVPLASHPSGGGVVTGMQVTWLSLTVAVSVLLAAFALGWTGRTDSARYLRRTLLCIVLFILFMSLLSGRHVPYISGYVYGNGLAVFLAMMAGLAFASAGRRWMSAAVAGLALYVAIVQLTNFDAINRNWIAVHNEKLTRPTHAAALPIAADGRATTREELRAIWLAWREGELDRYLAQHLISSGSVFLVFELRHLDKWRRR
jgi:hypothetical protein